MFPKSRAALVQVTREAPTFTLTAGQMPVAWSVAWLIGVTFCGLKVAGCNPMSWWCVASLLAIPALFAVLASGGLAIWLGSFIYAHTRNVWRWGQ